MIIRIPLDEKNSALVPIKDPTVDPPASGEISILPDASFILSPATIQEYDYSRYAYPAIQISINIPDADLPLVKAWFGQTATDAGSPSETLIKRMTDAVIYEIEEFYMTASRNALFTRPFRIGFALRLADGSHVGATAAKTIIPNPRAPLMVVRQPLLTGNILNTVTEIVNSPYTLKMSLPAFGLPAEYESQATHLDIFATRQCDTLGGDEKVRAIRTYSIFGENLPCWHYTRLTDDIVREKAESDNSFRIIGSLPIGEAKSGLDSIQLPLNFKNLDDWKNCPTIDPYGGNSSGQPGGETASHFKLITGPLDLGLPETRKRIRGLTARGIFTRDREKCIHMSLYGSHHRDKWRLLASSHGPHIRLLRAMRYRWLRVEITAPVESTFDALTFEVAKA